VCARLLLDPLLLVYYFAALKGPLFVGAAVVASSVWLKRGSRAGRPRSRRRRRFALGILARAEELFERVDAAMDFLPLVRDFTLALARRRALEAEVDLML
jgi:hypothetical protein